MPSANADELLHKQVRRQVPFSIPRVLSDRVDNLCAILNGDEGKVGPIYRHELVAALVAHAPESLRDLEKLINDYRGLRVRSAAVGDDKKSNVIELRPIKPGRRTS
jgi:hypothetical protein